MTLNKTFEKCAIRHKQQSPSDKMLSMLIVVKLSVIMPNVVASKRAVKVTETFALKSLKSFK
jgi:hypothetical protein